MYREANRTLVLSPTDLVGHVACAHRTTLERRAADGELDRPARVDAMLDLLSRRGTAHERAVLAELTREHGEVVEIPDDLPLEERARLTEEALLAGPDVIYQATFFDRRWRGHADFLLKRADRPSPRVPWSYDVADTKLASRPKPAALIQMSMYGEHLERLLGLGPENLVVITGDGTWHAVPAADVASYARAQRGEFEAVLELPIFPTYPEPVEHCSVCRWDDVCTAQRRDDDHLSLVAGMRRDHTRQLVESGIETVAALARARPDQPGSLTPAIYERLRQQAALQVAERTTDQPTYAVLDPEPGRGFALLPPPSPGDLFLDLEGDPWEGIEYLWGLSDAKGEFTAHWAHDAAEEKRAFEAVVDRITAVLDAHPDMHVYHYASYERSVLKRLMGRHATREAEVDRLLRGGVLVDLYAVVRGGVRVSRESYSIKKLEDFYGFVRTAAVGDGATSVVAYEQWMETRDRSILAGIERYNAEDVASTLACRDWLERLRVEAEGRAEVERPIESDPEASEAVRREDAEVAALVAELEAAAGDAGDDDARVLRQLAGLADWHRREAKPEWWEHFERLTKSGEELVEDTSSLGLVTGPVAVGKVASSTVWRYGFPEQETKLGVGKKVFAGPNHASVGEIIATSVDPATQLGYVDVKRSAAKDPVVCDALLPGTPYNDIVVRKALRRLIRAVLDGGPDGAGPYRAARDLLLRRPPRVRVVTPLLVTGEAPPDRVRRLGLALAGGALAVQGPPGSGKTWTGAQLAVDLVAAGRRVGVTAFSHKAIGNLLGAIAEAAAQRGVPCRIVQKSDQDELCDDPSVTRADTWKEALALAPDADVVAGTVWLWGNEELAGAVDTLIVDEAGQLSLANCLAAATTARNLVLLGDPQQLAQPAKGVHPAGAEVSSLEHVLDGAAVIPDAAGVFLAHTYRMAPAVAAFVSASFYDGRLDSAPGCERQVVRGDDDLAGSGVRWLPVAHQGNRSASLEEVAAVQRVVRSLLGRSWVTHEGVERPIGVDDVLVLAPYNVQVGHLRAALPAGIRVGTVDKLQGQEAGVVVYATTTSAADDIPRGLEFLYSPNRFNVAVSRARALCVLVASPALLHARCRTVDQLRLVNTMCRYVEMAPPVSRPISWPPSSGAWA